MEVNIRPYGDVLITSAGDVLKTSVRGLPMALHIGQYGDVPRTLRWYVLRTLYLNVLRTSVEDVLRTSIGDIPWRYIEDHMGTSIGRLLMTSSGRPRDLILPSGNISKAR